MTAVDRLDAGGEGEAPRPGEPAREGRGDLGHRLRLQGRGLRKARLGLRHHRHGAKVLRGGSGTSYVDAPVKASALIVEDDLFLGDARKASLGEFVSGRLLNVHQPLLNEEFVREAEVESKRG